MFQIDRARPFSEKVYQLFRDMLVLPLRYKLGSLHRLKPAVERPSREVKAEKLGFAAELYGIACLAMERFLVFCVNSLAARQPFCGERVTDYLGLCRPPQCDGRSLRNQGESK